MTKIPQVGKKISIFKNINNCSKPMSSKTILEVLELIRNNPLKAKIDAVRGEKHSPNKSQYQVWQFGKEVEVNWNPYEHLKNMGIPVVTWCMSVKEGNKRKKAETLDSDLTGFIYYDIDDFKGATLDEVLEFLKDVPEVFGVWKSLSKEGIGFLVYVDGLTKENFKANFNFNKHRFEDAFSRDDKGFRIDDLSDFTRINVLSSDTDIYIAETLTPIPAVQEYNTKKLSEVEITPTTTIPISVEQMHLEYLVERAKGSNGAYSTSEARYTYMFFKDYFINANICGIELDNSFDYLSTNHNYLFEKKYTKTDVYGFGKQIYDSYQRDFGSFTKTLEPQDGFIITDYNKVYSDSPAENLAALQKTYFDLKNHREFDDKFVFIFAIKCKTKGILYRYLSEYVQKYHWKEEHLNTIRDVYSNPWKPFGLVLEQTPEAKEKKINEYLSGDYKIIKETGTANVDKLMSGLGFFKNSPRSEHDFIYTFVLKFMVYGFTKEKIFEQLRFSFENQSETLLRVYLGEIFEKFQYLWGNRRIKTNNKPIPIDSIIIPEGKYISDIGFELPETNSIIWSDTGTGKTHWIVNNPNKAIIVVPTTNIIESIYYKTPSIGIYYGEKKSLVNTNKIITTYSSFNSLLVELKNKEIDLSQYHLYVDESHNLSLTSPNFRDKELNSMIDVFLEFKNTYLFTGTHIHNPHPQLCGFSTIRLKKEVPPLKNLIEVKYRDRMSAIERRLVKGKLNIILLQSKKYESRLGDFFKFLTERGWDKSKISFINSQEKKSKTYQYLIRNEKISEKTEILITTSLIIEGTNLNNTNCATLHFANFMNPHLMEQFANRFRLKVPDKIYYYKAHNYEALDTGEPQLEKSCQELITKYTSLVEMLSVGDSYDFNEKQLDKTFFDILLNNRMIRKTKTQFNLNYLNIASSCVKYQESCCFGNPEYLMNQLSQYNWKFIGTEDDGTRMDVITRQIIQDDKEMRFLDAQSKMIEIMETIPLDYNGVLVAHEDGKTKNDMRKISITSKILSLNRFMEIDSAIGVVDKWIHNFAFSENAYEEIKKKTKIQYTQALVNQKQYFPSTHPMVKEMVNYYKYTVRNKIKKVYSDDDLLEKFLLCKKKAEAKGGKFLKKSYSIEEIKNIWGNVVNLEYGISEETMGYRFTGINHRNELKEEMDKVRGFITKLHSEETVFTKEEIYRKFKAIRFNLPLLGHTANMDTLSIEKTHNILSGYCDIERVGRNQYQISAISPQILREVNWRLPLVEKGVDHSKYH